ncbi:GNAT family N-acetyltransferase [Chitinophaga tropicalis]|uniref:GNAT family N-acetyltransferase n=1 Tax=Chitinophaga tropicalis TaxID=2683588 RepID=A0A7K1U630_9BACT|nr:GNAT family N-acetyltransferase [Chitinophaga tropicalis]MVT09415.1 GNAT family N-acetyltransferase [Chitinophaga tropicalis]
MLIAETARLYVRYFTLDDAPFILQLLNSPTWLTFIGDRKVRSLDDARNYLVNGPIASYDRYGFGLYLVALKEGNKSIGMSGLIKRDGLDDVDVGFALHPDYEGQGYAYEATAAVMDYGRHTLQLPRIVAITTEENKHSIALLQKIGLHHEKMILLPGNEREYMYFS